MKKKMVIGIVAGIVMFCITGCTYNDIFYYSKTINVNEGRTIVERPPYVFRHEGYPQTYHLRRYVPRKRVVPIDASCSKECRRDIDEAIQECNNLRKTLEGIKRNGR